jgi:hypothetical protein
MVSVAIPCDNGISFCMLPVCGKKAFGSGLMTDSTLTCALPAFVSETYERWAMNRLTGAAVAGRRGDARAPDEDKSFPGQRREARLSAEDDTLDIIDIKYVNDVPDAESLVDL